MLLSILFIVLLGVSQCLGDTCYCTCCAGNSCQPTLLGNLTVSSCASGLCESTCKNRFPQQCTDGSGRTSYVCKSGGVTPSNANWVGAFDVENNCDQSFCCCPTGQLVNTRIGSNTLNVYGRFIGQGCGGAPVIFNDNIVMPTGYLTQLFFLGNYIQITLSQDSQVISMQNPNFPQCSDSARRSNANSILTAHINTTLVFLSVVLFIFTYFSK